MNLMRRFFVCLLFLAGCAAPVRVQEPQVPAAASTRIHSFRTMIVYVPQTDEGAASWLGWFVKYPRLRMVIACSPRFQRLVKDPLLKAQVLALQKEGRLAIALQIPNAPVLPLLVNSDSAKETLPAGSAPPFPPYAYAEDVTQLIAQSKADFFRQWNAPPRGLVVPHGAASPALILLLERLGFSWIVASLEAPAVEGPYQSGAMAIWDGTPSPRAGAAPLPMGEGAVRPGEGIRIHVWDERARKDQPLGAWIQEVKDRRGEFILPSDALAVPPPPIAGVAWKPRTWEDSNWSAWIGEPAKNAGWSALRKTRMALDDYKNSGQASVQRLDAAFEDIYSAQNSNYYASMGNVAQSPALAEERQHDFQATLSAVYRLIGQPPPDDLFQATAGGDATKVRASSTTTHAEIFPDGREHVLIEDAMGDAMGGPNAPDLQSLDVWASSVSVHWVVTLATMTPSFIDIYVDLNGQPNAGTPSFLLGRALPAGNQGLTTSPIDAWEYAIAIAGPTATLYRTQGSGTYGIVQTFPVVVAGNRQHVDIPRAIMRGSPRRWGYQVLVMSGNPSTKATIADFIDPLEISQLDLWQDLTAGKRSDIPFIRIRQK